MKCITHKIDCFIPYAEKEQLTVTINSLLDTGTVNNIYLLNDQPVENSPYPVLITPSLYNTQTLMLINQNAQTEYFLIYFKQDALELQMGALQHMLRFCDGNMYGIVYSDYIAVENGQAVDAPLIDCQPGSVRDDFDMGAMQLVSNYYLNTYLNVIEHKNPMLKYAAWYSLRLCLMLPNVAKVYHIAEKLYKVLESDLRKSGEKQFDYVDPRNRDRQIEMERVFIRFLIEKDKWVMPGDYLPLNLQEGTFKYQASVIIPVRNRERTIGDAIESALKQETTFPFNILIVDNYSTDATGEIIERYTDTGRVKHIIPENKHLGIGGCWNRALLDGDCGRFAVQLDSDDLYSGTDTLQRIVDKFYEENCAMVIGSYRMCNFQLQTLPPGLIDHKEWTENNGKNNALRINGLGAPRAFFTPIAKGFLFPNTSYGEDYAMGLYISQRYRIGRIYDELYLCRRWEGNSDAALSREKVNTNNHYKDSLRSVALESRKDFDLWKINFGHQLKIWPEASTRYMDLWFQVQTKQMKGSRFRLAVQYNPARMVSTTANLQQVEKRPCFLCKENRPSRQVRLMPNVANYEILMNPFPILPVHMTAAATNHRPQRIENQFCYLQKLSRKFPNLLVFYNGPKCGASAPDHMHFQMGSKNVVPLVEDFGKIAQDLESCTPILTMGGTKAYLYKEYFYPMVVVVNKPGINNVKVLDAIVSKLPMQEGDPEPGMNILSWLEYNKMGCEQVQITVIIPRKKHRPECYYAEGDEQILVSPGALDMAGLLITPRECDFKRMNVMTAISLLKEVTYSPDELSDLW